MEKPAARQAFCCARTMQSSPLILVTRIGAAGQALRDRLLALGFQAEHFSPVRLIGPVDPAACRRELLAALPCDRLIVPSAEAMHRAVELVGIECLKNLPLIVPGRGSARLAEQSGFVDIAFPESGGTSEEILKLAGLQRVAGLRIVILAAADGRRTLGRQLAERGANVTRLHVYQRAPAPVPEDLEPRLLASESPITFLASGGALRALEGALQPATWSHLVSGAMVAPSERVATMARADGVHRVEVACGADDQAMIDAFTRMRQSGDVCGTLGPNTD